MGTDVFIAEAERLRAEIERLESALDSAVQISHDMAVKLERSEAVIAAAREVRKLGNDQIPKLFNALIDYDKATDG